MSYLKLDEHTKNRLIEHFKGPIIEITEKLVINSGPQTDQDLFHRKNVLKQGQADFTSGEYGISAEEKVVLYGYYYFQMHYTSSYIFYHSISDLLREFVLGRQVHFVDFGCGPATSGLAFNQFLFDKNYNEPNMNYYGIDISQQMLNKGTELLNSFNLKYQTTSFVTTLEQASNKIQANLNNGQPQSILLNGAFVFASESLDVASLVHFIDNLTHIVGRDRLKCVFLFQNPNYGPLHQKWNDFKGALNSYQYFENSPGVINYQFDNDLGSSTWNTLKLKASVDVIQIV